MIMATNRPDVLDPALLRPGRLDRKIEIPLPNEQARMEILKIHAAGVTKHGDIDYEAIVKLADNFNGADLRNVCTEAGMFAIRDERDYTVQVWPSPCVLRVTQHAMPESVDTARIFGLAEFSTSGVIRNLDCINWDCRLCGDESNGKACNVKQLLAGQGV